MGFIGANRYLGLVPSVFFKFILVSMLLTACATDPRARWQRSIEEFSSSRPETGNPSDFAASKLRAIGLNEGQISKLQQFALSTDQRDDIVEKILLGFLKPGRYEEHYSSGAVLETVKFYHRHRNTFETANQKYGVDPYVISALMRVETKHGTFTGKTNVSQAYYSLLQADHPEILLKVLAKVPELSVSFSEADFEKIKMRAKMRSEWALGEIRALYEIEMRTGRAADSILGSYAGAFGWCQFIPSSYLKWSVSTRPGRAADLFYPPDAIFSVANYLASNGWMNENLESQRKALFHYNNATGYVNVILKIADEARASGWQAGNISKQELLSISKDTRLNY